MKAKRVVPLILVLCTILASTLACVGPTPAPTSTPLPTYTPYPTYTPLPTSTPLPKPTETPWPTVAPATEEPGKGDCYSDATMNYLASEAPILKSFLDLTAVIQKHISNSDYGGVMSDLQKTTTLISQWQAILPPPFWATFHKLRLEEIQEVAKGLAALIAGKSTEAQQHFNSYSSYDRQAVAEAKRIYAYCGFNTGNSSY